MSDHPADIHDGADPVEPTPEPEQVAETEFAKLAYPHILGNVDVPKGRLVFVSHVDHEQQKATINVRLQGIEVPLHLLERWDP